MKKHNFGSISAQYTKASSDLKIYTKEYILSYAQKDVYIYDPRCWRNGITKKTAKEMWDRNFLPKKGEWFNSGHFQFLIPLFKKQGGTFEELWEVMKTVKDTAARELCYLFEEDIEWCWNNAVNAAKNSNKEKFEKFKRKALQQWNTANFYRRKFEMLPLPQPKFANTSFEEAGGKSPAAEEKGKKHDVFKDERNRSLSELTEIFGDPSKYKVYGLYERGKISMLEREKLLKLVLAHHPKTQKTLFSYPDGEKSEKR